MTAQGPRWRESIVAAQVAVVALAIVDTLWVAIERGVPVLSTSRALLAAVGLALPAGVAVGVVAALIRWGWQGRAAPSLAEVVAAPVAGAAWAIAWSGLAHAAVRTFRAPSLTAIAITLAGIALVPAALALYGGIRRALGPVARRFPRATRHVIAAELALGAVAAPWHRGVGLVCAAGLLAFCGGAPITRRLAGLSGRALALASIAGVALALSPLADDPAAHAALARRGLFLPAIERLIAPLVDVDGDGYLAVLGGGDCDGFEAARSPEGVEIEGNGIDEDCRYGDLAPPLAAAPPPPGPGVEVVALITVAGLDLEAMPLLRRHAEAGIRFTSPVGIEGRFRDVAGVMIADDLPTDFTGKHGGFPTGGPTIPALAERAGYAASLSLPSTIPDDELSTQFARGRSVSDAKGPAEVVSEALRIATGGRIFVWAHLDAGKGVEATDRALVDLIDGLRRHGGRYRVLVVGMARDRPAPPGGRAPRGGPVALLGTGIAAGVVDAPVGLFDVYPTLLDALGLRTDAPVLGASLLRPLPARPGVLGGWIDGEARIAAIGEAGAVVHDPELRELVAGSTRLGEDARGPAALAPLIALIRDGWLAPRLAARNRARAEARVARLPADLDGSPVTIGGALRVLGCTSRILPGREAEITVYMEGGERLLPGDLISFKLSSAHSGSMRSRVAPVGGALPFGSWRAGELVAHRMRVELRPVKPGTAILWIGILRDRKLLRVEGAGSTPDYGRICNVEVPPS